MKLYVLFCFVGDSFSFCFGVPASFCCRSSGYMKTRPRLGDMLFESMCIRSAFGASLSECDLNITLFMDELMRYQYKSVAITVTY